MNKVVFFLSTIAIFSFCNAQSSAERVYNIFQTKCANAGCHSSGTAIAGLDLEGVGGTLEERMVDVYNNIYKVQPANSTASAKDNYLIYPGDPYRSFIYRKIDDGLSPDVHLDTNEGASEPQNGTMLTDVEKETVRQWILHGAKESGEQYDFATMEDYYVNGGVESIDDIPAPPAQGEGFQIHVGPFFLEPDGETEFMSKYETGLDETVEITKFKTEMGAFSHHFIVYNFIDFSDGSPVAPQDVPVDYGLRSNLGFDDKGFVITEQYSNTLELPNGTAMEWQNDLVLDLNSHYINYSSTEVLKCEVYLNVYTQESGIANQIMYSQLVPNTNIPIPNDNEEHTFTFNIPYSVAPAINPIFQDDEIWIWGLIGHTHKYGKDFEVQINGEAIYDGGCANGEPGCATEDFDYQHLPFAFYEPFIPLRTPDMISSIATYQNDGPESVGWGLTSDDEMMIYVMFFTKDTAGISSGEPTPTSVNSVNADDQDILVYPNPTKDRFVLELSNGSVNATVQVVDLKGSIIYSEIVQEHKTTIETTNWKSGVYFYNVIEENGAVSTGKLLVDL